MGKKLLMAGSAAAGWVLAFQAGAQLLSDPTRPPTEWLATHPGSQGGAAADDSGLRVLAVGGVKRYAIVDGQIVKPGDRINGSKVVAITRGGVALGEDGATQLLKPGAGIEKKRSAPSSSGKGAKKRAVLLNGNGGSE